MNNFEIEHGDSAVNWNDSSRTLIYFMHLIFRKRSKNGQTIEQIAAQRFTVKGKQLTSLQLQNSFGHVATLIKDGKLTKKLKQIRDIVKSVESRLI